LTAAVLTCKPIEQDEIGCWRFAQAENEINGLAYERNVKPVWQYSM
jgi:hypothetical protein